MINPSKFQIFPRKNGKLKPVLCDQVTQCLGSPTICSVSVISGNDIPSNEAKELWSVQGRMHPQLSVYELPRMRLFLPETLQMGEVSNNVMV